MSDSEAHSDAHALVTALADATRFDHQVEQIEVIETHISWVILTGPYAYKVKKPIDLGFLDFSDLDKRRYYCEEELRLNRRLAPELYLAIVPITGTPQEPVLYGSGPTIEYAVKMRQFPQSARLDRMLAAGELTIDHMGQAADAVAQFHAHAAHLDLDRPFGQPGQVHTPVRDNFRQLRALVDQPDTQERLEALAAWSERRFTELSGVLSARREEGFVRECHGDMHLANMAMIDDRIRLFDCIEFNEAFRWIDLHNEVAFMHMDLDYRQCARFAHRFLNTYLEHTGDYAGLVLSDYYRSYRALVRAKVAAIRLGQDELGDAEREEARESLDQHLQLAERYTRPARTALLITYGLSGSGKTTYTQPLVDVLGAVRVRSDIERKRLFHMGAEQPSGSDVAGGIYTEEATEQTYQRLAALAQTIVDAGFTVIVDATFLDAMRRQHFLTLARQRGVPALILDVQASDATLRERVERRAERGGGASEADRAVLEHQLTRCEPLDETEARQALPIDTQAQGPTDAIAEAVRQRLGW